MDKIYRFKIGVYHIFEFLLTLPLLLKTAFCKVIRCPFCFFSYFPVPILCFDTILLFYPCIYLLCLFSFTSLLIQNKTPF